MVNNVVLVGRITKDPEIKYGTNGTAVSNFTLAVNRNFKNKEGNYEADFINIVVFGTTAQILEQYVTKGQLLSVQGRIQTRNYENQQGQRVYVTEVVGSSVQFLESKNKASSGPNPYDFQDGFAADDLSDADTVEDDDLPF